MTAELSRCSRGEIWQLDWNPLRGSEPGGFRPALIVQSDLGNHAPGARTTILVPLSTQGGPFAFYIPIPKSKESGLPADAWANATQLITVDKDRLIKRLGQATPAQMKALGLAITRVLDL